MFGKLTKYILTFILTLPLLLSVGCADTIDAPESGEMRTEGMVTISLVNSLSATRANDSQNNEAAIRNAVVALYPLNGDDDTAPVTYRIFSNLSYFKSAKLQIEITSQIRARLFPNSGDKCRLYVVCNLQDPDGIPGNPTISQLRNLPVSSDFDTRIKQDSFVMAGEGEVTYTNDGYYESAYGEVTVNRAAAKITLNIKLPTSKTIEENGVKTVWYPQTDKGNIRLLLTNGVKNGIAAPPLDWQPASDDDYFEISSSSDAVRTMEDVSSETINGRKYVNYKTDSPFYTYPNAWENTPDETRRTMMTLVVPWRRGNENVYHSFYYQVPVTNMDAITANYFYTVNLNVDMLGSLTPEAPAEITDLSYQVIDWGKADIGVDIKDNRYLVVSPATYTANNEASVTIPFYTSHPAEITDIQIRYNEYAFVSRSSTGYADTGQVVSFTATKAAIDKSETKNSDGTTEKMCDYYIQQNPLNNQMELVVKHPLNAWIAYDSSGNEIAMTGYTNASNTTVGNVQKQIDYYKPSDEMGFTPYTIEVTISHIDDANYSETLIITQYPGMYIEADLNPGGAYPTSRDGTTTDYGYAFVNPTYHAATGRYKAYWENDATLGQFASNSPSRTNPNMYVMNITTLTGLEGDYIIGDPRVKYCDNSLSSKDDVSLSAPSSDDDTPASWSVNATALYNGAKERKLTYYYPTDESDDKEWMIAPKFRIASSYALMHATNRENARRRCASYQEQGFPAGRWRMPTYAEFKYIVWLGSNHKIPPLFDVNKRGYWTAQGLYGIDENGDLIKMDPDTNDPRSFVRPVYDEWFWENEEDYILEPGTDNGYVFTWGDKPLNLNK